MTTLADLSDQRDIVEPSPQPGLRVSVVIPVYNAGPLLGECVCALKESRCPVFEIIVVDDGSSDGSAKLARELGCAVVATDGRVGPAAARNLGASSATGDIIFFIDADVIVGEKTVEQLVSTMSNKAVDGVVGVQDPHMRFANSCSSYKNLWMYHTYVRQAGNPVPLFYTTAAAVRRKAFMKTGGFDLSYATPNVEDTDFGQKLVSQGYHVVIDPQVLVEHVKHYSLGGLLRADWARSVALTRLKLRKRKENFTANNTSVPTSYILSLPFALIGLLLFATGLIAWSIAPVALGLVSLLVTWVMNARFLGVLRRVGGAGLLVRGMILIVIELFTVGIACAWGMGSYLMGRSY